VLSITNLCYKNSIWIRICSTLCSKFRSCNKGCYCDL